MLSVTPSLMGTVLRWKDSILSVAAAPRTAEGDGWTFAEASREAGPSRDSRGLRDFLRLRREAFRRNLCEKLVGYALGRTILLSDEQLADRMTTLLEQNDGRFSVLVTTIVNSQQFRYRRGAEGPEKEEQQ